ncbi:MAG: TIR domain-containing protein, partial [Chryseobacterium sp.]
MKVFVSWSGNASHRVACALRDWLPMVIQSVKPYVSSEDIDKGTRWSTDIAQELDEATFGIICITSENINAPWINFEAGALSKSINKAYVSPFLFRMKRSEVQGPLLQFQSTIYEKEDVEKLLTSINNRLAQPERLEPNQLKKSFDVWWPQLEHVLNEIEETKDSSNDQTKESKKENARDEIKHQGFILEELLELAAGDNVSLTLGFNRRFAPLIKPLGSCENLVQAHLQKNRTRLPANPRTYIY